MDVVQVPFRRILGRLVWFDHPLSIDDELVPCRATVWYLDGSREEVLRRSGEREGFRPLVKVAGDDYGLGGRRRPEQVLVSVKWRERMYSEEAYHSTMNSYNSLMVSHQKS